MNQPKRINVRKKATRKVRRRIHKGRVALVLSVVALIVVGVMSLVSRCSDGTVIRAGGDFRPPVAEAIRAGRADARKVMETAPLSMEREDALLFIRSRENALREAGYAHAADDYINAAKEELKNLNIY